MCVFPPALELLKSAIEKAGYTDKIIIGMDVAASEFFRSGKYDLDFKSPDDPKRHISGDQLGDLYKSFIKNYPGTQTHTHLTTMLNTTGINLPFLNIQSSPSRILLTRMTGRTGPSLLPLWTSRSSGTT